MRAGHDAPHSMVHHRKLLLLALLLTPACKDGGDMGDPYTGSGSVEYPLAFQSMQAGTTYQGAVTGGGAAYYRLTVSANSSATLTLSEQSAAASTLSLVTVRTR